MIYTKQKQVSAADLKHNKVNVDVKSRCKRKRKKEKRKRKKKKKTMEQCFSK